jgi:hypothetical protein
VVRLDIINTLYLILVLGSLAFGLEALLIGLGGKLMVLYRRERVGALLLALSIGLTIVAAAIATSAALSLGPIYLCALVLVYMFVTGRVIGIFGERLVPKTSHPLPPQPSDLELEEMLRKRGYEKLVKKKKNMR